MSSDLADSVLTFETATSSAAVREGVWLGWRRTKLKKALIGVLLAAIVGAYIGSRVPGGPSFLSLLPVVAVGAGVYTILIYGILLARAIKWQTEAARRSGVERYIFDDCGITIENRERRV